MWLVSGDTQGTHACAGGVAPPAFDSLLRDAIGQRAIGWKSPKGLDANDLLQHGKLRVFIQRVLGLEDAAPVLKSDYVYGTKMMLAHGEYAARRYLAVKDVPEELHDAYIAAAQRDLEIKAA